MSESRWQAASRWGAASRRCSARPARTPRRSRAAAAGGTQLVPIEAIRPSPFQPRRHFAEAELDGLAQSIREKGIVQPLLVRPVGRCASSRFRAGRRRAALAGGAAGRTARGAGGGPRPSAIPRCSRSRWSRTSQREDLSPLEEAEAYSRLIREFGRSQASLAEAVGKSRSHVANTLAPAVLAGAGAAEARRGRRCRPGMRAPCWRRRPGGIGRRGGAPRSQRARHRGAGAPPPAAAARRKPRPPRDADTLRWSANLAAALGLRVTLAPKRRGGSLTLHYASLDQLDRILALLRRA